MKTYESVLRSVLEKIESEIDTITAMDAMEFCGYSQFHFHRLFQAYTGESVSQYIKRLKLQKAAKKIQHDSTSVTEIALDAGYATHSAFCVAFREMYGVSPTEFKAHINVFKKEYKMLKPEIITIEPINVLAVRYVGTYMDCGDSWHTLMKFAYMQKMKFGKKLMGKNSRMFGVGYDDPNMVEASKLRYDACITKDDDVELEDGIRETVIEGGKYARFLHKGSYEPLADKYREIYGGWVVQNNIKLRDLPPFEEYLNRDPHRTKPENLRTLIYVPIQY